jgi:two-component sensor histidine kinase
MLATFKKLQLEKIGYTVHNMINGEDAVNHVCNLPVYYDLILMDINLGSGMDGPETAKKILNHKEIPILFFSAYKSPEIVKKTEYVRSYGYVVKDSGIAVLDASIKMALKLFYDKQPPTQSETDKKRNNNNYQTLLDSIDEGYCIIEIIYDGHHKPVDFSFVEVNAAFESQTGILNAKGRRMREIAPEHEDHWFEIFGHIALTGQSIRFQNQAAQLGRWYDVFAFRTGTAESHKVAILFNDITNRRRSEVEISNQLIEKEILLKEVHHRVKNNIITIESLLSLRTELITNAEAKMILEDSIYRVQSMRVLYENLLITGDYQLISIKQYLENLLRTLAALFPEFESSTINTAIEDLKLPVKFANYIGIILNELVTNMYKHAFSGTNNDLGFISIEKKGSTLILTVIDNGIGVDENISLDYSNGFGLPIVQMLIKQLNGIYTMKNENGTKIVVQIEMLN